MYCSNCGNKVDEDAYVCLNCGVILKKRENKVKSKKNNIKADYYYNFTYDDNKISQSVKIYNKEKKLQTNYYIIYNDEPISYTKGEKAVVTINAVDLKNKPMIYIAFEDDINKKYEVVYKK